jgi:LPXTG-motif cell wall-anchored protein
MYIFKVMAKTKSFINKWALKIALCALVATGVPLVPSAGVVVKADSVIDTTVTPDFQGGIAISSDGTLIAYAEQGTNKVHFLDSDLNLLRSTVTLTDPNTIIIDSTKTFAYVMAINGGSIYTIDIATANVVTTATTYWNGLCVRALPGGTHVLTCEGLSLVKRAVADLQAGTNTNSLLPLSSMVFDAIPNSDGSRIYVNESSGNITVVDSSLSTVATFARPNGYNPTINLSPDGSLLAVASSDYSTTKILNALTGETITTLPFAAREFSPDGRLLYGFSGAEVGIWEGWDTVQTYRVGTWELVKSRTETGYGQGVYDPTGAWFYSISRSPDAINKVAISPDLVLDASAATSSTGLITFVLDANADIDCTTLSTTIGIDFDATGVDSIDRIEQTNTDECTIFVNSSARPGLGAVTSSLTSAGTFSISGRSGLMTDMFGISDQGSTVVTIQATTTTTTTTTVPVTTTTALSTSSSTLPINVLPETGRESSTNALIAIVMVLIGGLAVVATRRRLTSV